MKHLLILLISITSVNYLFGGAQYNACRAGYNLRGVGKYMNGVYYRPGIDLVAVNNGKTDYNNVDDQNAFLWGYFYAGCSDQDGGLGAHRSGANTGWFADSGHSYLGQQNDGANGWNLDPKCQPEATQGADPVCADKFAIE